MTGGDWRAALGEARAGVTEAQTHLLAPTAEGLESAWAPLERASAALKRLLECLKPQDDQSSEHAAPELRAHLDSLTREIARLRALLEGAAALRLGWARRLYSAACGYTPQGEPASPRLAATLSVVG